MSDFNKSNVGFQLVGCRIFTSRMSDLGFLQVGCRMAPISFRIVEIESKFTAILFVSNVGDLDTTL